MSFANSGGEMLCSNFGLIFHVNDVPAPVPLTNVSIKSKIIDFIAEVGIEYKTFFFILNNLLLVILLFL